MGVSSKMFTIIFTTGESWIIDKIRDENKEIGL